MAFNEYFIGKRERMSWVEESTYGTEGTMSSGEIVGLDCTITPNWGKGWQDILSAGADSRTISNKVPGPLLLPYSMTFVPTNWVWLKYLMDVADSDDSGVKTHTFTMRDTVLSYTLEWAHRHTTPHVITTTGNVVKSATMNWSKATGAGSEGFLRVALDCVAQDYSEDSSVTSLSNITNDPFQYRHCKVTIGGSEITEVNNGRLTINNGIDENDSRYCNSTYDDKLGEPIPKIFRVTGQYNVNIKDTTFFDYWDAGTKVSGTNSLLFIRDDSDDQILFTFGDFFILGAIPSTNLQGITNVDVVFESLGFSSVVARDAITNY